MARQMVEEEIPEVRAALIFTSDAIEVDSEGSSTPAMKLKQLKDFIRQRAKEKPLGSLTLESIKSVFEI